VAQRWHRGGTNCGTHSQKRRKRAKNKKINSFKKCQARNEHVQDIFIAQKEILRQTVFPEEKKIEKIGQFVRIHKTSLKG
jgi:hypothetical protein